MPPRSDESKKSLLQAAQSYRSQIEGSPAEKYLSHRGVRNHTGFGVGYVGDPFPGHEQYAGRLALPYVRETSRGIRTVVSLRFRCTQDHDCGDNGHGKYLTMPGDRPRLFNTLALQEPTDVVGICEGEIDAISATLAGIPSVGVPGVASWKPFYRTLFLGYRTVYVFADGDKPGRDFADKLARELPNSKVIDFGDSTDVNSYILKNGEEQFLTRL